MHYLARQGVFPTQDTLALDPPDIVTSARFGGADEDTGMQTMRGRDEHRTTAPTRMHSFRLIVGMETNIRIPVAAKLAMIQESGRAH